MTNDELFSIITNDVNLTMDMLEDMSEEDRGQILDAFKAATDKFERLKKTFVQFILSGKKISGWAVREGAKRCAITEQLLCCKILRDNCHMTQDEVLSLCNIPLGKLQDYFQSSQARVNLSPEKLRELIRPAMTETPNSPTLVKSKS